MSLFKTPDEIREKRERRLARRRSRRSTLIKGFLPVGIVLGIVGLLTGLIPLLGVGCILLIASMAMGIRQSSDNGRDLLAKDEAIVPCDGVNLDSYEVDVTEIEDVFIRAGFTNVRAARLKDVGFFSRKRGDASYVTINGNAQFRRGDIYRRDAEVIVWFHSI